MKSKDLIMLGAVAIGGYFLLKMLSGSGDSLGEPYSSPFITLPPPGGGGTTTTNLNHANPLSVFHATVKTGSYAYNIGVPYNPITGVMVGKLVGNYTTGTPSQQTMASYIAPKVVLVNGKAVKVM